MPVNTCPYPHWAKKCGQCGWVRREPITLHGRQVRYRGQFAVIVGFGRGKDPEPRDPPPNWRQTYHAMYRLRLPDGRLTAAEPFECALIPQR